MTERVIMLGAGGHARVLQETLAANGITLAGFIALDARSRLIDVAYLGDDTALTTLDTATTVLVNGIGSVSAPETRASAYDNAIAAGFRFLTVVDPTATVRASAVLGMGTQVLAGAIVNTGAVIGVDVIVNTGSIVEHDNRLGDHVHLSPGVVLGGDVTVGARSHIGLGARALQGITIGEGCTVGAGAVVTRNIDDGMVAIGVPAVAREPR